MMNELVKQLADAHGGLDNWNKFSRLIATLSFGGLAFKIKLNNKGIRERRFVISINNPMVVIENFPGHGKHGVFTPDAVWIETYQGEKIVERNNPRLVFKKWRHRLWWDDLDLLYFAGYAAWNYFNTPFLFSNKNFEVHALDEWNENGEVWQRAEVLFPEDIPTHCRQQVFYFDKLFRIRRFDYNPEVFASWAKAAHYCNDYKCINGVWLPAKRKVLPRKANNASAARPLLVWIDVKDMHLQ